MGSYKVIWRCGYLGGTLMVWVGIKDADDIKVGATLLEDAIRRAVIEAEHLEPLMNTYPVRLISITKRG
jgi:hypothetical protein